jgi:hypothetical protein
VLSAKLKDWTKKNPPADFQQWADREFIATALQAVA